MMNPSVCPKERKKRSNGVGGRAGARDLSLARRFAQVGKHEIVQAASEPLRSALITAPPDGRSIDLSEHS